MKHDGSQAIIVVARHYGPIEEREQGLGEKGEEQSTIGDGSSSGAQTSNTPQPTQTIKNSFTTAIMMFLTSDNLKALVMDGYNAFSDLVNHPVAFSIDMIILGGTIRNFAKLRDRFISQFSTSKAIHKTSIFPTNTG
ncbi:hypothetical protein RJT34_11392 [Clitoria ternatea]|uniref:Uncharacterized protein n=1 Tax=Clitoria ternatea TaxID=43366 RepID=A0AAN9PJH5_CLITE